MNRLRWYLLSGSVLAAIGIFYADAFVFGIDSFDEATRITFSRRYLLRSGLAFASSAFFVSSILAFSRGKGSIPRSIPSELWEDWGSVQIRFHRSAPERVIQLEKKLIVLGTVAVISAAFTVLFLGWPKLFSWLSREDRLVELLSVLILLAACGVSLLIGFKLINRGEKKLSLNVLSALVFALLFFVIGMEEISWGQRFLNFETPSSFSGNAQGEFNLHNFATNPVENVYYWSVFVLLVAIPFITDNISRLRGLKDSYCFLPDRISVYAATLFIPYNYDMWNIFFIQFAFFTTILILIIYALKERKEGGKSGLVLMLLLSVVGTQAVFLIAGDQFIRPWDVTEYKELFIPIACLFFVVNVASSISSPRRKSMPD